MAVGWLKVMPRFAYWLVTGPVAIFSKSITTGFWGGIGVGVGVGVGVGAGTPNSMSSTASPTASELTSTCAIKAFGSETSNGILIACGLGLGLSTAVACQTSRSLRPRAVK